MPDSPNTYPVYLYNSTNQKVQFIVNQGDPIAIPAAAAPAYAPATPTSDEPQLVESTFDQPGMFFLGMNYCSINMSSGHGGANIQIDLTNLDVTEINSAQLYIFFKTITSPSWMFLINGKSVTGSLSL